MQVNSQLLDTVQHKVRLGEQLDEMEVNIVGQIQVRRISSRKKPFLALKGYQTFICMEPAQPKQAKAAVEWICEVLCCMLLAELCTQVFFFD